MHGNVVEDGQQAEGDIYFPPRLSLPLSEKRSRFQRSSINYYREYVSRLTTRDARVAALVARQLLIFRFIPADGDELDTACKTKQSGQRVEFRRSSHPGSRVRSAPQSRGLLRDSPLPLRRTRALERRARYLRGSAACCTRRPRKQRSFQSYLFLSAS